MAADGAAAPQPPPPPPVDAEPAGPGPQAPPPVAVKATKKTYQAVGIPSPEQIMQEDLMNNCGTRTIIAGVMGGLLGGAFGAFMGAFELTTETPTGEKIPWRQVVRETALNTRAKSWSYTKGFSQMGALYSGSECVIEKVRAQHDSTNSATAGCFTGGFLARSAGWQGAVTGCATFAAFSVLMDKLLDH